MLSRVAPALLPQDIDWWNANGGLRQKYGVPILCPRNLAEHTESHKYACESCLPVPSSGLSSYDREVPGKDLPLRTGQPHLEQPISQCAWHRCPIEREARGEADTPVFESSEGLMNSKFPRPPR